MNRFFMSVGSACKFIQKNLETKYYIFLMITFLLKKAISKVELFEFEYLLTRITVEAELSPRRKILIISISKGSSITPCSVLQLE